MANFTFKNRHMKNFILILGVLFCIHLSTQAQSPIILQEGTVVQVQLLETLDSRLAKVGDLVNLRVNEDVEVDGVVVIKRGTEATGRVTISQASKMAGKKGMLDFTIDYTKTVTGKNIRLNTTTNGGDGKSYTTGVIAAAAIVNPLALLIKGKNVTVEKGKLFSAYVGQDYELTLKSSETSTERPTQKAIENNSKAK
jgi:hypothetical protein